MALLVVLVLLFAAVGARLATLQVVAPQDYVARGEAQRLRTVTLPAERGAIFDRNGMELALSVRQRTVWADPRLVTDPTGHAGRLAPVLGIEAEVLEEQLSADGAFVYLARKVGDDVAARVDALELDGVSLLDESKRFAPAEGLATSLIGDVNLDNVGTSGLERQYEDVLVGAPGSLSIERGPDGSTIAGGRQRLEPPDRGDDLVLTLDRSLQFEVERSLGAQITATGALGGTAVVMDPRTGQILAMANLRSDGEGGPPKPSADNMAVTSVFEPGSVNKVITLAAALEEGAFTTDDVLTVPDELQVSVHRYSDSSPHPTEQWSLSDILTKSSNVGTIKIAQELGPAKIDEYLTRFGLGEPTGLGFPDESSGIMLDLDEWSGTSIGSIPIGSGVAVNAVQMLDAFNVIANGGELVQPSIVRATIGPDGTERPVAPSSSRRVVSEGTAAAMRAMLANVITSGTGTEAAIDGYTVAGKTGTAKKPDLERGGYEPGAYMASFAGFVPAEDPQLSTIVVLDEPRPVFYGGLTAAPVFADITRYALRQLRIPPAQEALPEVTVTEEGPAPSVPRD
ncbi:MAG: Cell division protein FtsI [Peptidoglycan synthetase] [uncultured Acidimicrobiales bacterium]|uniref:Cell division protein FtsI [Peptidoglycan synthetase] n=1 Tax=uncultured Acidimicrobiales bacterium TaxID=310071 RepID=A0A6J4I147_9ACTN|nr:MAG: Cell division protein FtsI [Peptidoglycan synthetase] [uncultured Acidimicrobiales bacterium]